MSKEEAVNLINVKKNFRSGKKGLLEVLKGVNLNIKSGEFIAVTGASGSGKSTLLNLIGGLDKPTDGLIYIKEQEISNLNERQLSRFRNSIVGFVFQFHHLLSEFTALENVMIPLLIRSEDGKTARSKALKMLEDVGLGDRSGHKPGELSGGECQRVAVARALISDPDILLADEPTGNLDKKNGLMIEKLLKRLNRKYKKTFIVVTHNMNFARRCGSVFRLDNGTIKKC